MAKATKTIEPVKFKPVVITLVLESVAEVEALRKMCLHDLSIPNLVTTHNSNDCSKKASDEHTAISDILVALKGAI
jgi:hypothetical protein